MARARQQTTEAGGGYAWRVQCGAGETSVRCRSAFRWEQSRQVADEGRRTYVEGRERVCRDRTRQGRPCDQGEVRRYSTASAVEDAIGSERKESGTREQRGEADDLV